MADPIVIPGAIRVVMGYKELTQDRVNVFHVGTDAADHIALSAIADVFDNHDLTFGAALRTSQSTLNTITVTDIGQPLQPQYVKAITPPRAGTAGASTTPGNVTSTVSWRGQFIGKRYRGRSYVVDTPYQFVTADERITGVRQGNLASWGQGLLTALETATEWLGIGSPTFATLHKIVSVVVEPILDSQRRRLPGRGR